MRIPAAAILLACGIPLLGSCNDSASSPTAPQDVSFASTKSGKKDWVTGQGLIVATYPFSVSAHSGSTGEKANGHLENSFVVPGKFKVGCLAVDGNRAVVGGVNPGTGAPLNDVFLIVEDNGPPGSPVPDRGTEQVGGTADDATCALILRFGFPLDPALVIDGDVEVIDGTSGVAAAELP